MMIHHGEEGDRNHEGTMMMRVSARDDPYSGVKNGDFISEPNRGMINDQCI